MSSHVAWSTIRAEHIARAGGEDLRVIAGACLILSGFLTFELVRTVPRLRVATTTSTGAAVP